MSLFSTLTKKQRDALPEADFGWPERRLYPIVDQSDVDAAARLIGKAPDADKAAIRKRITAIAKRKGLSVPDAWQADHSADGERLAAEFAMEPAGRRVDGGYAVYPNALLFRAGEYHDKQFALSPEEMWAACETFQPVGGNIQHTPFLAGRACEVRSIRLDDADPFTLRGEVAVPLWLDENLAGHEKRLSCEWDRETKTLSGLALVVNPRVEDAALLSAFAAFARRHDTRTGQINLQLIHDLAAQYGAECKAVNARQPRGADKIANLAADFASHHEATALQAIHDMTTEHGARCEDVDTERRPYPLFSAPAGRTGTTPPPATGKEHRMSWKDQLVAAIMGAPDDLEPEGSGGPSPVQQPAQMSAAPKAESDEVRRLRDQAAQFAAENARLRLERIQERAVTFAEKAISEGHAFPAERETLVTLYVQAAADDGTLGAVTFADGNTASRVDLLERNVLARPKHQLTLEGLAPQVKALFDQKPDPAKTPTQSGDISDERKAQLRDYARLDGKN